jgi:hypothetical protein
MTVKMLLFSLACLSSSHFLIIPQFHSRFDKSESNSFVLLQTNWIASESLFTPKQIALLVVTK